ncbi:hypothetical protein CK203_098154 [Vitis vinifera]|uniref:Neprosin PEP catalytic domain-containing protein n=1 Tax=Vitis vinifera TaxID=29760 RepID=A0A438C0U6_VITVI|nr:hypothetical protein CK203_098154 [Vitis vinifera]
MPRVRRMKEEEVKRDNHISSRKNEERMVISGRGAWQVWHQNRTRCPKGTVPIRRTTVPIRRTTVDNVLRAQSLHDFGKKQPRMALARHTIAPDDIRNNDHEYAYVSSQSPEGVYGAYAEISLWNPSVQDGEMSISHIWVVAGSFSGSDLNTMDAGWQVDTNIVVGSAIAPVFTIAGTLYETNIFIWKKIGGWGMEQHCSGILAIKPVHTLSSEGDAGGVGWGGGEYQA